MTPTPAKKLLSEVRVLVVGDLMLDRYLWGDVRRISPEAPVPVFHVRRRSESCGGAANVVANLAGLGCAVTVVGVVGRETEGRRILDLLRATQHTRALVREAGERPTVTKTRVVAQSQQLIRIDEEDPLPLDEASANAIRESVAASLRDTDAVVLSDYGKGILDTPGLAQGVITAARAARVPVFVDPKGRDWTRYRGATCVTPNANEFELASGREIRGESALLEAMHETAALHELEWLLVTRGREGMCLVSGGRRHEPVLIRATAREVYDVSGAGDTVIATLSACAAAGIALPDAAALANTAAGIVVGKIGTQPVTWRELQAAADPAEGMPAGRHASKLMPLREAAAQVQGWQAAGETVVFTNGCFDLLHPGHIHLLNQARDRGTRLVVGLNSDGSVTRLKGSGRPILREHDRASLVGSLDCVDLVVVFDEDTPEPLLHALKPDVLVKGSDYAEDQVVGRDIVASYGGRIERVATLKGHSSSQIVERAAQSSPPDAP